MTTIDPSSSLESRIDHLAQGVARVIQGKDDVIRNTVICLLARGHLLLEDRPGTGKTSLARALAASVDLIWNRVQFTPDLLPTDITGGTVYNQSTGEFPFRPGPIFANIVLADEINRASPKTQSALLEVMEEGTVSNDGVVYQVPQPFMVIGTQNPVELGGGTYPLPEAQLDRFLMRLQVGYPDPDAELAVLRNERDQPTVTHVGPVMDRDDLFSIMADITSIEVDRAIDGYVVRLANELRTADDVQLAVSPRGSLALIRAARVAAAADGRDFVSPQDVKDMALATWPHRMVLKPEAELQKRTTAHAVRKVLESVDQPRRIG